MVETWGTGRKDYSDNVEYSVQPILRSHLRRIAYNTYAVPAFGYVSFDWGYLWTSPLYIGGQTFDEIVSDAVRAGLDRATGELYARLYEETLPIHVYQYSAESASNHLVDIAWFEYPSFYDAIFDINSTALGRSAGFKKATLKWTAGIVMQNKTYAMAFNAIMDRSYPSHWPPDYLDMVLTADGAVEDVVYG